MRYEIEIQGHLDGRRARGLGCDAAVRLAGDRSLITAVAPDQAALYGLLSRCRDLGLALVALRRIEPAAGSHPEEE